jgi:hypothetical protein
LEVSIKTAEIRKALLGVSMAQMSSREFKNGNADF